jgi:predicted ATPase
MSASAIGALERGARRAPYRETVSLLAEGLGLSASEHAELEAAAASARGRSGSAAPARAQGNNLPERLTSFVGREAEVGLIKELLSTHRLVTITGSGGVGKTSIALEVGRERLSERPEDVWFVDLSPIRDENLVAGAIASILGVNLDGLADAQSLAVSLRSQVLLLVLDNCEHVIDHAAGVAGAILRTCPGIMVLATSRERLAIAGEHVYRLPSLAIPVKAPATLAEARSYPALQLLFDRSTSLGSDVVASVESFTSVVEICRRLEGIPLAIELAATRVATLGFHALNQRLKAHLEFASGGRDQPHRQRTMAATIEWSYELLTDLERILFRRVAIFSGGATLEAVEYACAGDDLAVDVIADVLSSLVEKSLLNVAPARNRNRYTMLDSVRAFATTELVKTDEFVMMEKARAGWLTGIADRARDLAYEEPRHRWLVAFGPELDNVRGALTWLLSSHEEGDARAAGNILDGLRGLWSYARLDDELCHLSGAVLLKIDPISCPLIAARLMSLQIQSIKGPSTISLAERAIPLLERAGDGRELVQILLNVTMLHIFSGHLESAQETIARAFVLAAQHGLQRSRLFAKLLEARCATRCFAGRPDEARSDLAELEILDAAIGVEKAIFLVLEYSIAAVEGNFRRAADLLEACIDEAVGDSVSPASILVELAGVRFILGETEAAASAARDALETGRTEQALVAVNAIGHLAGVAALRGKARAAARLFGFSNAWMERVGRVPWSFELTNLESVMTSLRAQLSDDVIASLAAEGALLDLDRATDEALAL